jgi:pimeloyl-ACP methyl ester carboxylesterase
MDLSVISSKSLTVDGLSIAVHETRAAGPAIVLVHGNSCSSRAFERQLAGELGRTHRLVAIDLPGHGASSRATDPARTYTLPGYAHVLVEVARQLDLPGAVFFGWSLGGHVVLEASGALPRAAGFALMGTPPIGIPPAMDRAFFPLPALGVGHREDSTEEEVRDFQQAFFKPGTAVPRVFAEDFRRTDARARSALAASVGPGGYLDEVDIAAHLEVPLAILHGEHERIANGAYIQGLAIPRLWRGSVQVIRDAGHAAQWEAAAAFDELLSAFARDCPRRG